MFQTFSQTTKALGFLLSILALSLSLSYLVLAWTEPSSAPPLGNVSSPLNIGSTGQSKSGGLIINTSGAPTGLIVQSGNVGIGTTGPQRKLDVSGRLLVREGVIPNGWDIADWGAIVSLRRPGAASMASANDSNAQLELVSDGPTTSHISFHRPGIYGANFGLDSDNWLSTQGWSAGAGYTNLRAGTIRSMSGGIQFPDGTTQTSAASGGSLANVAQGKTPITGGAWVFVPGNLVYVTDNNDATATTDGGLQRWTTGYVQLDLGGAYLVEIIAKFSAWTNLDSGNGGSMSVSEDGASWQTVSLFDRGDFQLSGAAKVRYIRLTFSNTGGSSGSWLNVRLYELRALQLQ